MIALPPTIARWQVNLLTLHARFLAPTATCGETYEVLAVAPQLPGLAIIEGDRIVGSIDRHSLLATFARPVVRDLYERRPIALLMDRAPLIVDPETSIHELSERISREKPSALMSGFIVAIEGRFIGIGSVLDILQLQVAEGRQREIELEAARAEAVRADAASAPHGSSGSIATQRCCWPATPYRPISLGRQRRSSSQRTIEAVSAPHGRSSPRRQFGPMHQRS
jgi:hypothetical protein